MERELYCAGQDARIARLLHEGTTKVAFFEVAPSEILGWVCYRGVTCHYVYVKGVYRRCGIGKGLVPEGIRYYTHATNTVGGRLAQSLKLQFNPYNLEYP